MDDVSTQEPEANKQQDSSGTMTRPSTLSSASSSPEHNIETKASDLSTDGDEMGMEELINSVTDRVTQAIGQQLTHVSSTISQASQQQAEKASQAEKQLLEQLTQLTKEVRTMQAENSQLRQDLDVVLGTMPESASIAHFRATGDDTPPPVNAEKAYEYALAQYDPLVVSTFIQ